MIRGPPSPTTGIGQPLKTPTIADKLLLLIADYESLNRTAVIGRLKEGAGRNRPRAKTEDAIGETLIGPVADGWLEIDDA
ncbi:hypothetical protein [Methylobacterium brachiatum]|uniref:hypothetical protein n=1 Tax=Methylobacterium brachiatum TaxID=269660 RepID=UPI00331458FA